MPAMDVCSTMDFNVVTVWPECQHGSEPRLGLCFVDAFVPDRLLKPVSVQAQLASNCMMTGAILLAARKHPVLMQL